MFRANSISKRLCYREAGSARYKILHVSILTAYQIVPTLCLVSAIDDHRKDDFKHTKSQQRGVVRTKCTVTNGKPVHTQVATPPRGAANSMAGVILSAEETKCHKLAIK
jgi:hypothetical protein